MGLKLFAALLTVLFLSLRSHAQEFRKMLTVGASIESAPDGKLTLKSESFTIPERYRAVNLKFNYVNMLNGKVSSELTPANIYDVKQKKNIEMKAPIKEIPQGEYLLRIEGAEGSCATLTYDLEFIPEK